jgi:hypothetical protein
LGVRALDKLDKLLERSLAIPTTLKVLVDKEVENPILVNGVRLVGQRYDPDHR